MSVEKSIVWRRLDVGGHEYARIYSANLRRFLEGAAIFVDEKKNCRLDYTIECDADWRTVSARIAGFVGDEKIEIEIAVDAEKRWTINNRENEETANCTDIDLNFSPLTNTLPVRRLNLQIGEKAEVRAAWLKFSSFKLEPLEQIYTRLGENKYRYESANGAFVTEIETDDLGLVTLYPNLWEIEK